MISAPEAQPKINWTKPKLRKFRRAFVEAMIEKGPGGVFKFEGHEFLIEYAAYLIKYLEGKFNE